MKYVQYAGWAVAGGFAIWVLWVIAGLGSIWVSVGIVGFVGLMVLINRITEKPSQRVGQPTPERRVTSTDIDRWGGGGAGL